jgi:predicted dehydrogenase
MWGTKHSHAAGKLKAMKESPLYEVVAVSDEKSPAFLNDPAVDLIVAECAVWDALDMGARSVAAGKHLHLEKPPGIDLDAFRRMIEEARDKKLLIQLGYLYRFHEGTSAALDAMHAGWLGDIQLIRATMNSDRDAPQRAVEARYKGGSLYELGGHVIDRVVAMLGRPRRVQHWLKHGTRVADNLNDNGLAVLEYDRACAVVSSAASMSGSGEHRVFEVVGSDGSFIIQPLEGAPVMKVQMREARGPYKKGWQEIRLKPQPRFTADFDELATAILSKRPLRYGYDHELLLHETLLRASGEL